MSSGLNLYLVRHGETAWNREEIFRGRMDVPLNAEGRRQARAAAAALRAVPLEAVYASPLRRALDTARAIAGRRLSVTPLPDLTDMAFGPWEGRALRLVKTEDAARFQTWKLHPERARFPGGESLARVRRRVVRALRTLARQHPNGTVALVTHRVVAKLFLLEALGLPNRRFWTIQQDNACVNLIEHRAGRYIVRLLNDTCHLRTTPTPVARHDF